MVIAFFTILAVLPVVIFMTTKRVRIRVIKLESYWESLVWTCRLWRSRLIFPNTLADWYHKDLENMDAEFIYVQSIWIFLLPFFVSRGYAMYQRDPVSFGDLNPPQFPPAAKTTSYPYARQVPSRSLNPRRPWSIRIWAARDALGRDVMIKVISEVDKPSNELKVMQLLNSKKLRSDPGNHTIYALDYITFDKFIFVVMPRWDSSILPEFETVSELMLFAKTVLETFDFLHRNKVVHLDCLTQNIGMNAVLESSETSRRTGLRDPKEVRYALFDFGASEIFPEDTNIEEARISRRDLNFGLHGVPPESVTFPYNPFRMDVAFMGNSLETYVRHLENRIPELGPFFDSLVDVNDPNQLSASQAFSRFTNICNGLSPEVANAPNEAFIWQDGAVLKRYGDIITIPDPTDF
ncbi:hypothetical protein JR316_0003101 [Psilocybe cubensis]|uniref:Protein kinase domain-containing protein n=2 Tax=Psilocybe cubensis TaxID=181762 RepID=A0A8H7Y235_PSICU|nr:hypothetical protein JR316_0003101 [Psilocybe cubensis]KAH9483631.1 hypothetical protein JR316_0003101 [Psilocybe cubensis]